ncbi:MAG TPA: hypothetical protein VGK25_09325, partial [Ignavibacteria bacterium]
GKFEMAEEIRLEMICDKKNLNKTVEKIYEVHPYDEPAFEIYEVLTGEKKWKGQLLKVILKKKIGVKELLKKINPEIDHANLPKDLKKIKISECIIDSSASNEIKLTGFPEKTLYIKKNKKNLKAYLT